MAPGILSPMVPHLCLYLRYWWNNVNFLSAVITFDKLYSILWQQGWRTQRCWFCGGCYNICNAEHNFLWIRLIWHDSEHLWHRLSFYSLVMRKCHGARWSVGLGIYSHHSCLKIHYVAIQWALIQKYLSYSTSIFFNLQLPSLWCMR